MRVDDLNLAGSGAARSGQAGQAEQVERSTGSKPAERGLAGGADRVELSGLTDGLARVLQASCRERAARVERLAVEYAAGRYSVDAKAVSRAIVAEMKAQEPPTE